MSMNDRLRVIGSGRRNAPFMGCVYLVGVPSLVSAMERAKPYVDNPDWRLGASLVVCAVQKRRG
jgi:hypothetical protein